MAARPRRRYRLAVILLLAAVAGGMGAWQLWPRAEPRPAFTLPDLDNEQRAIAEWDGRVIVLNFWASWCPPCVNEIPVFTDLQDDYGNRGLQVLGVAVDRRDRARAFHGRLDMNYPSLYGVAGGMAVAERYGNERGTLPYTVVIDRTGAIVHRFRREITREDIEPLIRKHL
ncbi:TlpA disulfide reductase family protein [Aquisalimonas lutea]|uniref:TlpA family protein disulfide reductase n=1 Tax=Aquisalimonas lutea TaxID=1327750 RepID=UPI0025B35A53|nr:TlpA disulfide reductase family protein [Aquisalimonas lutea]MDN3516807.1 TlpA disulfide reductase family protein [Aquisalimonas lutea]